MFGIKLNDCVKEVFIIYDINVFHSPSASISPLNGVKTVQPVNIAIFSIKLNVLMRILRKYDFIDTMNFEMGRLDPDPKRDHKVSILKGSHVWYQIEGHEEIWQIM